MSGRWVALAAAGLGLIGAALPPAASAAKPNIVLVMTDDQTVENMRVMPHTRRLLGSSGTTFANSFSSYPLCCPARATLLTGQYAHNHGVFGNLPPTGGYGALTRKDNTLPVWLRGAGYYTTHIGKYLNGYGRDAPPDLPPGWDEWYGSVDPSTYFMWGYTLYENGTPRRYGQVDDEDPSLYQPDVYRDKAVDLIRRRARSPKPFYLSVGFLAPHSEGGREVGTQGSTVRSAPRHRGRFADMRIPRLPGFNESDVGDKPPFFADAFPALGPSGIDLAHNYYRSRAESLLAVDEAIRAIVGALRKSGELDNTLIIFASDNGFLTGEHRVPFGKYLVYEPSIRVPTILRGPGVKRGATARELVVNPDVAATIVDAAGAKPGRALDGRSLLPFARRPSRRTKRPILLETGTPARGDLDQDGAAPPFLAAPPIPRYQAVRTDRFVYVEYADGHRELYDLARDPAQLRSRHADPSYRRTRRALARRLDAIRDCKGRSCRAEAKPVPGPGRAGAAAVRASRCPVPPRAEYPQTDGARDARSKGALFRRVEIPGFTDRRQDTAGVAIEDFNHDARADLFAIYNDGSMRMLLGRGCLRFREHRFRIVDSPYGYDNPPGGAAIANWADFNDDGHLDAFITHNTDGANTTQRSQTPSAGNSLLLSRGAFDRFKEEGPRLGVTNATAYNRASSILDVDRDGHLDIAVGADQIGRAEFGGASVQRLYVWRPRQRRFEDIGGSERVPGFGGPLTCDPRKDKASPGILLRDLDEDGRPDLVQGYHNDMLLAVQAPGACVTGERDFGLFAWRNRSRPGRPKFGAVPHPRAGLGGVGRMRYDYARRDYEVVSHGYGLPYVFAADAFNTGRLDLIAVGPTDPEFHVNSDMVAGKFFRNAGGLRFVDETRRRGLGALNWTSGRWARFYDVQINEPAPIQQLACGQSNRKPLCGNLKQADHQPYGSTVAWGDFDNDGCLDFVFADRHEDPTNLDGLRNTLFRNRCNGTFEPVRTQLSGLDTNNISVEVADLNDDGLLDLVAGSQPTNTYPLSHPPLPDDRYYDKVFLNRGTRGARSNHFLEVDLTGRPQRRLIGAQLSLTGLRKGKAARFLGRRDYVTSDSYKSGRWPTVHWGLGKLRRARIGLRLPGGRRLVVWPRCVDHRLTIDVRSGVVRGCPR